MERIRVKIIRRGKQLGFIMPKRTVKKLGIKPGDDIEISFLKKQNPVAETFGLLKGKIRKSTDELMRESDRELYPEDFWHLRTKKRLRKGRHARR